MAQTQHTNSNQRLVSMWSDRNSHSLLVGVQNDTDFGRQFGSFS